MKYQLIGKIILSGKILCVTGLHIGGTTVGVEIGGVDNPVIKDPLTDRPFIPGSSLKGKLRSLSEWSLGLIAEHKKHKGFMAYECPELKDDCPTSDERAMQRWKNALVVGQLYGAASDDNKIRVRCGPSRLIVRDSFPSEQTLQDWKAWLGAGVFTEVKTENALDRVTSEANPRPLERVPAGSTFDFSMLIDIYDSQDFRLIQDLLAALRMLEHSTLGGSGSRGSGQVKFKDLEMKLRPLSYYKTGEGEQIILEKADVEQALKTYAPVVWQKDLA